jgi:hypothetical protein
VAALVDDPLSFPLRCLDERCATLLPGDAELCDECGGSAIGEWQNGPVLVAVGGDRPAAFPVGRSGPIVIGRGVAGEPAPDADLGRLAGAASVHRRHATIEPDGDGWRMRHLGRNPLVVQHGGAPHSIDPGGEAELRPGDGLLVGAVRLRFLVVGWAEQVEER